MNPTIYTRDVLHWLPFPQRISYRIASLVRWCLSGWAPSYLRELCLPLSSCASRRTLRSSAHGNLVDPFARSAIMQTRSFSVVAPKTWNGLSVDLRHLPKGACSQFHQLHLQKFDFTNFSKIFLNKIIMPTFYMTLSLILL